MAKTDPKAVQDLTSVVQTPLQQIFRMVVAISGWFAGQLPLVIYSVVQTPLQQMQDKFQTMSDQIIGRIDDTSSRIDDLEKNITDLMTQAGVEELDGENKIPTTQKS
ncbi:heat shock factor-binding protein 1-like [Physeter macrocephalus]|uniref:Heat shock factor-binding protein 1 n=1 Tax=Physeter macrocephalus TaxID=9755 RepID=A0A9W2WKY0_PHYMC|nr:heat shock factor-binding protein 1-like [Physeter catodon]